MSFFNRKPITGATGMDLLHAAAREKWSDVLRILQGSDIDDQQSMDNTLLLAVSYQKHKVVTALLDAGAKPDAMDGRMLREAASNADVRTLRILFARKPAMVRYAENVRHHVYSRWADTPGGDGSPYQETIDLLDRMLKRKTAILARARRKKPRQPGIH